MQVSSVFCIHLEFCNRLSWLVNSIAHDRMDSLGGRERVVILFLVGNVEERGEVA